MIGNRCDRCDHASDRVYQGRRVDYRTGELFGDIAGWLYLCGRCWKSTTWVGGDERVLRNLRAGRNDSGVCVVSVVGV
jgi:hypothetical protein